MAKRIRAVIWFSIVAICWTAAAAAKVDDRRLDFTVFATRKMPKLGYWITKDPKAQIASVGFYPTSRSVVYGFRGDAPIRFKDLATDRVVAVADVPARISRALLIFVPLQNPGESGLEYTVYVVDDNAANYGPGDLAVFNASDFRLEGNIGASQVAMEPGYYGIMRVGSSTKVTLSTQIRSRSIRSFEGLIELSVNQRALLILMPPYRRGSPEVQYRLLSDTATSEGESSVKNDSVK